MKKIISSFFLLSCFFIISCQKKVVPVTNSLEANEKLDGSWVRNQTVEMDVYSDPENPDSLIGSAKAYDAFTLSFFSDLSYSMKFEQVYDSFIQTSEEMPYTLDEIKNQITYDVIIKGTYAADESKLQLCNKSVVLRDGSEVSIEDYAKIDPSINGELVESFWTIEDDKLTVTSISGSLVAVYKKVR